MPNPEWFQERPPISAPTERKPGVEVWRLREPETGRIQTCEIRDDTESGARWDVQLIVDDDPLSRGAAPQSKKPATSRRSSAKTPFTTGGPRRLSEPAADDG